MRECLFVTLNVIVAYRKRDRELNESECTHLPLVCGERGTCRMQGYVQTSGEGYGNTIESREGFQII